VKDYMYHVITWIP